MDRQQKFVLFLAILALFGATIGAAWFSQESSGPALDGTQRFTAKPGTTRENAVALSSSKRPSTDALPVEPTAAEGDSVPVQSLSGSEQAQVSASDLLIERAVNQLAPAQGLLALESAIAEAPDQDARALLEAARGVLLSRLEDSQWPEAQAAFDRAAAAAQEQSVRERIIEQYTQALIQRGELDAAESLLLHTVTAPGQLTNSSLRLSILLGSVYELQGQSSAAVTAYEQVVERLLRERPLWTAESADLARLASLRLAPLYRDAGEEQTARKLARRVQARLLPQSQQP